jgi:lipid II:glycine glycyltransferase (peptidoglycan interpeptide bridge formation enzyme)
MLLFFINPIVSYEKKMDNITIMKTDRTIRLVTAAEQKQWNTIVGHPLQSWEWGDFRASMGHDVVRLGIFDSNRLIEGWQLSFHSLPFLPFTVGYFPKGPKPTGEMIHELINLGRKKRAIYIQMEPDCLALDAIDTATLKRLTSSHRPLFTRYTFVLDISRSEDELLAAMHPKTRYNIRVAQKHKVIVSEDNSKKAFEQYLKLSHETTLRQGFYAHNTIYHKTMWNLLHKVGIAHLFTAVCENTTIAAWIVFVWKDTVYYPYGASSRTHREVMAPNLMLWEIVRWAKKQGLYYFDLWGALGPYPDKNDPWYGFHRFKESYKPDLIEFTGSYDLVIRPVLYALFTTADTLRWLLLKLKFLRIFNT